jgi:hypothetical protein
LKNTDKSKQRQAGKSLNAQAPNAAFIASGHICRKQYITLPLKNQGFHVAITPKYRKKVLYGRMRKRIRAVLREQFRYKGIEIPDTQAIHIYGGL